jgi:hypothetical protein
MVIHVSVYHRIFIITNIIVQQRIFISRQYGYLIFIYIQRFKIIKNREEFRKRDPL